jgi:DNA mismatch endonuclease (patch repair protein)
MTDTRTTEQRRRIMQSVKGRNTGPEMTVRRLLYGEGYRYRLNVKKLPGSPDIVFLARRKVVFVHGCYWHGHGCRKGKLPKSRLDYWGEKIEANRARDARKEGELQALGWDVLTVWQCEIADTERLTTRLKAFLGDSKKPDRLSRPVSVGCTE